ncbi:hypothetical protein FDF86_01205 [Clostridium botulinum]|uniref:hypothetical protein n=1 Tax=Clostridium botulinum TaxID=1491 RepID=UPI0007741B02|nr:hypothetical protein [Clostridium botulinum]NFT91035.1 hypothetical protein [Clostridium botulinum]
MGKFEGFKEKVYLEILNLLRNHFTNYEKSIYAIALEIFYGEEYGIKVLYQTKDDLNIQFKKELEVHKYDVQEFEYLNEAENMFFLTNNHTRDFWGSILYYIYDNRIPIPNGYYDNFGISMQNGVLDRRELPDDTFTFLEDTALFCAEKLKHTTEFIRKDDDFLIFVCHESTMYYRYPLSFIRRTVDEDKIHLLMDIVSQE